MGKELVLAEKQNQLAHPLEFTNEQIKLLGETVAKDCNQSELAFFLNVCKMKRLDPFSGQIHVVKRWDSTIGGKKMSIQVGIDGFRVIAARSGDLAGISEPEFDSEDGECPKWARVTVYRYGRGDEKIAYTGKARFSEYMQTKQDGTPNHMWAHKPYIMLGKCAEALALRKAFPDELSGMYSDEEMEQADNSLTPASVDKKPVSMPKSVDEKKPAAPEQKPPQAEPPHAETTSTANPAPEALDKLSGEILSVTPGKNGVLVLNVDKKVVVVPARLANPKEMVAGSKILCSVAKVKIGEKKLLEAREVEMVVPPVTEDGVVEGEIVEPEEQQRGVPDPKLDEYRKDGLDNLFGDNPPPRPAQTKTEPDPPAGGDPPTKPGTIGVKRAKRLYTLISQNHKNTGFTEEEAKKILSALPSPIEHFRDIELGMYPQMEKWALGEEDFQDFWKD